jgi:hypothetical protein
MKKTFKLSTISIAILFAAQVQAGDVLSGTNNTATGTSSVVAGGEDNKASSEFSSVGGGKNNNIKTDPTGNSDYSTISGGLNNTSVHSPYAVVVGGEANVAGSAYYSVIGGGLANRTTNSYATVGGGKSNKTYAKYTTISGGAKNQAGTLDRQGGANATVAGGIVNKATGESSFTVGSFNEAMGKNSIAMGNKAKATEDYSVAVGNKVSASTAGSFVFGDSNSVGATTANQRNAIAPDGFYAYFAGGYTLNTTGTSSNNLGVSIGAGGGAWNTISDKNKKENFKKIDKQDVLDKLVAMPMESWNYKAQNKTIRHIGPYAQDFNKAYGLGDGKLSISTIDSDGVALVSVQALAERNRNLSARNKNLESKVISLEERFSKLEKWFKNK